MEGKKDGKEGQRKEERKRWLIFEVEIQGNRSFQKSKTFHGGKAN